jgi:proteasome accessory factor A
VLGMIEDGAVGQDLTVDKPVESLHRLSHDPSLRTTVEVAGGRTMTGVQLLWCYYELVTDWLQQKYAGELDDDTAEVMQRWEQVLAKLECDPMEADREVDWVTKLKTLESYRARDGLDWSDPRLRAIDIQWSDVRADKGLFNRMQAAGRVEQLVDDTLVKEAVTAPPRDTRAYFRGTCLARFPREVAAASWDSVIFDVQSQPSLQRVPMLEPERGTEAHVGPLLERATSADELLRLLADGTANAG